MVKKIGLDLTKAFKKRVNEIIAFPNFNDFVSAHLDKTEALKGDLKGNYSMTLNQNYRIIVSPSSKDLSPEALKKITTFKIIGVIDYHGKGNNDSKWLIP